MRVAARVPVDVYAVSDVHAEHGRNAAWTRALRRRRASDALVVAGDVADDVEGVVGTLDAFRDVGFGEVFYTFGNHECWITGADERRGTRDSTEKIREVMRACAARGARTKPARVGEKMWIAPLHAYHHASFDTEPDVEEALPEVSSVMNDFRFAKWPAPLSDRDESVAAWCDALNDDGWDEFLGSIERGDRVISFSHFLPRIELLPEKRMLFYPKLAQASGSVFLRRRIDAIKERVNDGDLTHVFGHTHFGWNQTLDGVRYVQAALATPSEWVKRPRSLVVGEFSNESDEPLCVFKDGEFINDHRAMWSDYYSMHERAPEDVELAPHAREFIRRRWGDKRRSAAADSLPPPPGATGVID